MGMITTASKIFCASALFAAGSAYAAPPIAYAFTNGKGMDLNLINPDGTGKVLLYSTAARVGLGYLDMNPVANQIAVIESRSTGFKVINYNSAGVLQSLVAVNDGCGTAGLDFHPTDGSLLVQEYCASQDMIQIRRWTSAGFDTAPLVTFGSGQNQAVGQVRWLGDGSGFLVNYMYSDGTAIHRRLDRYMIGNLGAPVTVTSLPSGANADFDTARCGAGSTGPCWALAYDDGTGHIHKLHFDSMGATEDSVLAGASPHFSPSNGQLVYRLQSKTNWLLKVDSNTLVSKGDVAAGIDWHP